MNEARIHGGLALLYALGVLIIVDQLTEFAITLAATGSFASGSPPWRWGAVGMALGRSTALVLGDVLIAVAAFGRGDWLFLRVWGWLHAFVGVALLLVMAGFSLDALTVRRVTQGAQRSSVELTSARALAVGLALAGASLIAGIRTIRLVRTRRSSTRPVVIVGAPASTRG